jgi:hypothetical protein
MTDPRPVALLVCQHATDVDDARHLLGALGLLDERNRLAWPQGPPSGLDVRSIKDVASVGKSTRL